MILARVGPQPLQTLPEAAVLVKKLTLAAGKATDEELSDDGDLAFDPVTARICADEEIDSGDWRGALSRRKDIALEQISASDLAWGSLSRRNYTPLQPSPGLRSRRRQTVASEGGRA
jgi:hypothetical protein